MKDKKWKRIPRYSLYEASTDGEIKTFNWKNSGVEAIMKPALDNCGYLRTMLKRDDGITHTIKVHRIIAETFIPNHENKPQINHINGIRNDNRLFNLEWCTPSENAKHSFFLGRSSNIGEKNPSCKLSEKQVIEIKRTYKIRKCTRMEFAKKYNISESQIKSIISGRLWKHLL